MDRHPDAIVMYGFDPSAFGFGPFSRMGGEGEESKEGEDAQGERGEKPR